MLNDALRAIEQVGIEKVFLLLMAPIFLVCMIAEAIVLHRRRRQTYSVHETGTNVVLALSHAAADGIAWGSYPYL